jgi:hypothetical protein
MSNPYPHISSDPQFLSLLQETKEIVESVDFARVLEGCLDRGVECLVKGLEKNVFVDSGATKREASSSAGAEQQEVLRIRLAGVFPGLARWSQLALAGVPSELVDVSVVTLPSQFLVLPSSSPSFRLLIVALIRNHYTEHPRRKRSPVSLCYRVWEVRRQGCLGWCVVVPSL